MLGFERFFNRGADEASPKKDEGVGHEEPMSREALLGAVRDAVSLFEDPNPEIGRERFLEKAPRWVLDMVTRISEDTHFSIKNCASALLESVEASSAAKPGEILLGDIMVRLRQKAECGEIESIAEDDKLSSYMVTKLRE